MPELLKSHCEACRAGAPEVDDDQAKELLAQIPDWAIHRAGGVARLERLYHFRDFVSALAFTNEVGALAERMGHHPELTTGWGQVKVVWYTHKINGLHLNDFICAAHTDALFDGIG